MSFAPSIGRRLKQWTRSSTLLLAILLISINGETLPAQRMELGGGLNVGTIPRALEPLCGSVRRLRGIGVAARAGAATSRLQVDATLDYVSRVGVRDVAGCIARSGMSVDSSFAPAGNSAASLGITGWVPLNRAFRDLEDTDWFRFTATAGKKYTITLSGGGGIWAIYGANRSGAKVSQGVLDQFWLWSMQAGLKNAYDSIKAFSETDFTEDLKKFDIPTLVMHGEDDQIVPVKDSAKKSAKLIKGAVEIYYPGLPHGLTATHADLVNRDLLAFCQQDKRKVA
jgi:pimeloyl-ACP methyl ester carboxylesterase